MTSDAPPGPDGPALPSEPAPRRRSGEGLASVMQTLADDQKQAGLRAALVPLQPQPAPSPDAPPAGDPALPA